MKMRVNFIDETDYKIIRSILAANRILYPYDKPFNYVRKFVKAARIYGFKNITVAKYLGVSIRTYYRIVSNPDLVAYERYESIYNMLLLIQESNDYNDFIKSYNGGK